MDLIPYGIVTGVLSAGVLGLAIKRIPKPLTKGRCRRHCFYYLVAWLFAILFTNMTALAVVGDLLPIWMRATLGYTSLFLAIFGVIFHWAFKQYARDCESKETEEITQIRQNSIVSIGEAYL